MYSFAHSSRFRARGFTLVELLVVIAILGILLLLFIPLAGTMQNRAHSAQSASNMRQIGSGLLLYAQDHGYRLPGSTHQGRAEDSWIFTLSPYIGDVDAVRICPADSLADERYKAKTTSYTLNGYLCIPVYDPFTNTVEDFSRLDLLPRPAETFMLFPLSPKKGAIISGDHTHSRSWQSWGSVLADIEPDRHRSGDPTPARTKGHANYLFADAHVESIDASEIKSWIDSGHNFSRPPQ